MLRIETGFMLMAISGVVAAADMLEIPAREMRTAKVFSASELFADGTALNLVLDPSGHAVELRKSMLVENDSPGAGVGQNADGSFRDSFETITGGVQVRKILNAVHPSGATLTFHGTEPFPVKENELDAAALLVTVNGREFAIRPYISSLPAKYRRPRIYWYCLNLPDGTLKAGANEIILKAKSERYPWLINLSEYADYAKGADKLPALPRRQSFKSTDGGVSWSEKLGAKGEFAGEYMLRLNLSQYRPEGVLTTRVIDLADLEETALITPLVRPCGPVVIVPEYSLPEGTAVRAEYRCGDALRTLPNRWSGWLPLPKELKNLSGRFIQLRFIFTSSAPQATPSLKGMNITARMERFTAEPAYQVTASHNEKILRTSFPFEYEKYDEPQLTELRRQYQLDTVVRGKATEFDKIVALADWTSKQYIRKELGQRTGYPFPPWNALTMLHTGEGWFCLQQAIGFMQACLSMGIPCRIVTMHPWSDSGHEVAEAWSNDYRKWVFFDPGYNYYTYDRKTGVPLSLLELQQRLRQGQDKALLFEAVPGAPAVPLLVSCPDLENPPGYRVAPSPMNNLKGYDNFRKKHEISCYFLRWMPRNNFLGKTAPMPLNHGTIMWPWDGYINLHDEAMPDLPQYSRFTARPADAYWNLNLVHFKLSSGMEPDTLIVQLDTETPNLKSFMARVDGGDWREVIETFTWKLHTGDNRLELCTENSAGVRGPVSYAAIAVP